jgi:hypothetical protein
MTQDEIIEMARQAGMDYLQYISPEAFEKVTAFCKLVAQHEREACAKVCEQQMQGKSIWIEGARACSLAIRATGSL